MGKSKRRDRDDGTAGSLLPAPFVEKQNNGGGASSWNVWELTYTNYCKYRDNLEALRLRREVLEWKKELPTLQARDMQFSRTDVLEGKISKPIPKKYDESMSDEQRLDLEDVNLLIENHWNIIESELRTQLSQLLPSDWVQTHSELCSRGKVSEIWKAATTRYRANTVETAQSALRDVLEIKPYEGTARQMIDHVGTLVSTCNTNFESMFAKSEVELEGTHKVLTPVGEIGMLYMSLPDGEINNLNLKGRNLHLLQNPVQHLGLQ